MAKKGASDQMLKVIGSFLRNRTMTVRLGQEQSEPRRVHTGAPQGSVLGCFLFNIGIDTIEDGSERRDADRREVEYINRVDDFPASSTPSRVTTGRLLPDLSPIREDGPQIELLPRAVNAPEWIRKPKDPRWKEKEIKNLKYVDDGANLSKVNMRKERLLIQDGVQMKCCHNPKSQAMFDHITREADLRGMKVNHAKTGLICFSADVSFKPSAVLYGGDGSVIPSKENIKILGFTFDADGGCSTHIENLAKKMRRRTWALLKLKRYGFTPKELTSIYTTYMQPLAEYVSPVWHLIISAEQSAFIEKQQTQALRHIFGYGPRARKLREKAGLDSLHKVCGTNCTY